MSSLLFSHSKDIRTATFFTHNLDTLVRFSTMEVFKETFLFIIKKSKTLLWKISHMFKSRDNNNEPMCFMLQEREQFMLHL